MAVKARTSLNSVEKIACMRLLPQALAEKWTTAELARKAGVCNKTAQTVLRTHSATLSATLVKAENQLVAVARSSQKRALARLPELESLLEKAKKALVSTLPEHLGGSGAPVALDDFGQPIPIDPKAIVQAVSGMVKASKDLYSHMEQITGLDVVKAVSVRSQTNKDGPLVSWDGVEALAWSVDQDKMPALPAPSEQDDDDFC